MIEIEVLHKGSPDVDYEALLLGWVNFGASVRAVVTVSEDGTPWFVDIDQVRVKV